MNADHSRINDALLLTSSRMYVGSLDLSVSEAEEHSRKWPATTFAVRLAPAACLLVCGGGGIPMLSDQPLHPDYPLPCFALCNGEWTPLIKTDGRYLRFINAAPTLDPLFLALPFAERYGWRWLGVFVGGASRLGTPPTTPQIVILGKNQLDFVRDCFRTGMSGVPPQQAGDLERAFFWLPDGRLESVERPSSSSSSRSRPVTIPAAPTARSIQTEAALRSPSPQVDIATQGFAEPDAFTEIDAALRSLSQSAAATGDDRIFFGPSAGGESVGKAASNFLEQHGHLPQWVWVTGDAYHAAFPDAACPEGYVRVARMDGHRLTPLPVLPPVPALPPVHPLVVKLRENNQHALARRLQQPHSCQTYKAADEARAKPRPASYASAARTLNMALAESGQLSPEEEVLMAALASPLPELEAALTAFMASGGRISLHAAAPLSDLLTALELR